jgi:hypothetical protein
MKNPGDRNDPESAAIERERFMIERVEKESK